MYGNVAKDISELRNYVTDFKNGRKNYETKMAATRRDLAVTWA
jgi:hypothetical protein